MKSIQIADDLYDHLLRSTSYLGEDATSILRRLLQLPGLQATTTQQPPAAPSAISGVRADVRDFIGSPRLQIERNAVQKFLVVLSWLHEQHPQEFGSVTRIEGRTRLYFAKDSATLTESGSSVFPQQIPGSEYWVVTNNDTPKKKRILEAVLRMLRYTPTEIRAFTDAIG